MTISFDIPSPHQSSPKTYQHSITILSSLVKTICGRCEVFHGIAVTTMSTSPFYVYVVYLCGLSHLSFTFAISVYKATGSLYFGVIPPIIGKATHETLTPPDEGISILGDASYLYHKTNSGLFKIFENIFGSDTDEVDSELNQGVYKCENGACAGIKLDEKQQRKFEESLERKTIKTGNALTNKVKKMKANSKIALPAPPLLRTDHINFEEMERQRKLALQRKLD